MYRYRTKMKVLILNSGMGSRMEVLTSEHPKCMSVSSALPLPRNDFKAVVSYKYFLFLPFSERKVMLFKLLMLWLRFKGKA